MFYETGKRDVGVLPHDPFKAIIAPRPIGWISTRAPDGRVNLAPYSLFNAFSNRPPIIGFSSEGEKDSASFARDSGEFVFNFASLDLMRAMSATSAPLPRGTSEFEHAGIDMAASRIVGAPRVAASPASLECKVVDVHNLRDLSGRRLEAYLVLGEVVGFHIADEYIVEGRFDLAAAKAVARCGYQDYAVVDRLVTLARPTGGGSET